MRSYFIDEEGDSVNTKIAEFVSKKTNPYFFSQPEDEELTAIHTEVQRSIEAATDQVTIELDLSLMAQAEELFSARGWTLEEGTVLLLYWLTLRRKDGASHHNE